MSGRGLCLYGRNLFFRTRSIFPNNHLANKRNAKTEAYIPDKRRNHLLRYLRYINTRTPLATNITDPNVTRIIFTLRQLRRRILLYFLSSTCPSEIMTDAIYSESGRFLEIFDIIQDIRKSFQYHQLTAKINYLILMLFQIYIHYVPNKSNHTQPRISTIQPALNKPLYRYMCDTMSLQCPIHIRLGHNNTVYKNTYTKYINNIKLYMILIVKNLCVALIHLQNVGTIIANILSQYCFAKTCDLKGIKECQKSLV